MRYFIIVFFTFGLSISLKAQNQRDSVKSNHLTIKTDVLFPTAYLIDPEVFAKMFTLAIEYRASNQVSIQLNASYLYRSELNDDSRAYLIIPEFRHFFNHHFAGAYLSFGNSLLDRESYPTPKGIAYQDNLRFALGVLYGYQREFGRLQLEGRIGFGIAKEYMQFGATGNGAIKLSDEDAFFDAILGINVGYRIF